MKYRVKLNLYFDFDGDDIPSETPGNPTGEEVDEYFEEWISNMASKDAWEELANASFIVEDLR